MLPAEVILAVLRLLGERLGAGWLGIVLVRGVTTGVILTDRIVLEFIWIVTCFLFFLLYIDD